MNKRLVSRLAISSLSLLGLVLSNAIFSADFANPGGRRANELGSMGPVPKAHCGPSDHTEHGLQGMTTTPERTVVNGRTDSELGYNCNLELVGQFKGQGAFSQDGPAYFDHCAYMATENDPGLEHPGVVVIDVSDPAHPRATAYLGETAAGRNPHENIKVNQARGLLGLAQSVNPTLAACGSRGTGTRVYDIRDPLHPAEIAYWKGPAPRTAFLPGAGIWSPTADRTVEKQAGLARFVKVPAANGKGHELNLWIVGDGNGFQVLRFTDEFLATQHGKAIHVEALRED